MSAYWTLSQAATWITHRSEQVAAEAPRTVVELQLIDAAINDKNAAAELWAALTDGKLTATGIASLGLADRRSAIDPTFWQDLHAIAYPGPAGTEERLQRQGLFPGDTFVKVTVPSAAVMKLWPAHKPVTEQTQAPVAELPPKLNLRHEVALLITTHWPNGKPVGLKMKEWENQIIELVKQEKGSEISVRTAKRAIKIAKR